MANEQAASARRGVGRRQLLKGGAAVAAAVAGGALVARESAPAPVEAAPAAQGPGRIVHSTNPPLEESPLEAIEGWLTPTRIFYVRNHFQHPETSAEGWKLKIEGHVERPMELSLEQLKLLPSRSIVAFLECAGNSRGRFSPRADGTQWGNGAIGNAEWTGVSVATLLELVGMRPDAVDLVAEGADAGKVIRGLPISIALDPDTMVVWAINGEPLPQAHGFPLRLFVPGWIGVASIKWLQRLEVLNRQFEGLYNNQRYVYVREGQPTVPATVQPVKSAIVRPAPNATLGPGTHLVSGFAWSGSGKIIRVEVSADGGQTWADARIAPPVVPRAWVRFELPWQVTAPGSYVLASRASDDAGQVQPPSVEWNRQGYGMNAIYTVPVTVGGAAAAPTQPDGPAEPVAVPGGPVGGQPAAGGAPAQQVAIGATLYAQECARCHGANGEGDRGPQLVAGPNTFEAYETADKLFRAIKTEMPLDTPGSLTDDQYYAITAHLLDKNGLNPEGLVLGPETAGRIRLRR